LFAGGANATNPPSRRGVTPVIATFVGGAHGVRGPIEFEISELPFALVAMMVISYGVPFFKLIRIKGDADVVLADAAFTYAFAPGNPYEYDVIGNPLFSGTSKYTVNRVGEATTFVITGANGTPGIIETAVVYGDSPTILHEAIEIVTGFLLTSPGMVNGLVIPDISTLVVPFVHLNLVRTEPFVSASLKYTYAHPFPGKIFVTTGGTRGKLYGINIFDTPE
jgi:hypothetical protein